MRVLLTGATGTAGSAALRRCLADSRVEYVTVLARRPPSEQSEKLRVIIHSDFQNYEKVLPQLEGHTCCLWCLGISQSKVSRAEYETITYDYALAGARAMASVNPKFTFLFLSGDGADSTEKSRVTFAKVKGKTENALLALGHHEVYCFRPGYIDPEVPIKKPTMTDRLGSFLAPVFYRLAPSMIIPAADLGRAMLNVAANGFSKKILNNNDIRELSKG